MLGRAAVSLLFLIARADPVGSKPAGCAEGGASCAAEPDELAALQARGQVKRRSLPDEGDVDAAEQFCAFLKKYRRSYEHNATEYQRRFEVFKATRRLIDERNECERTHNQSPERATHGVTKFADWTEDEFRALLGYRPASGAAPEEPAAPLSVGGEEAPPCSRNWASRGQVRNQGKCGDCWAFSTAEVIRSTYIQEHGRDPGPLSTQFLDDCMEHRNCSVGVNGCCGFTADLALEWIQWQGGIPTVKAYGDYYSSLAQSANLSLAQGGPVSGYDGYTYSGNNPTTAYKCKSGIPKAVTIQGGTVKQSNEKDMSSYVCGTGSLSIAVDASTWNTYTGGVMSAKSCGKQTDHAVLAIGLSKSKNAWIVQNSWGTDWGVALDGARVPENEYSNCAQLAGSHGQGCSKRIETGGTLASICPRSCSKGPAPEAGYIYLEYGNNTCGLAYDAVSPKKTVNV